MTKRKAKKLAKRQRAKQQTADSRLRKQGRHEEAQGIKIGHGLARGIPDNRVPLEHVVAVAAHERPPA